MTLTPIIQTANRKNGDTSVTTTCLASSSYMQPPINQRRATPVLSPRQAGQPAHPVQGVKTPLPPFPSPNSPSNHQNDPLNHPHPPLHPPSQRLEIHLAQCLWHRSNRIRHRSVLVHNRQPRRGPALRIRRTGRGGDQYASFRE